MLIAVMCGKPGRTYVITATYTERFSYEQYGWSTVTRTLNWPGLMAIRIEREVANFGRAKSLWVVQTLPAGVEPLRTFWDDRRGQPRDEDTQTVQDDRVVLTLYDERANPRSTRRVIFDVQMSPSAAVSSAALVAVLLLFVSTYVYQQLPGILTSSSRGAETLVALARLCGGTGCGDSRACVWRPDVHPHAQPRTPRAPSAALGAGGVHEATIIGALVAAHGA